MGVSGRLRLEEVKAAFRLVGECRDLGRDADAWRLHAAEGMRRLVGALAANGGELRWPLRQGPIEMLHTVEAGFSGKLREIYPQFMRQHGPNDPLILRAFQRLTFPADTQPRSRLVEERVWRKAAFYQMFEACELDQSMISFYELDATRSISALVLHRATGERDFSARERNLLHLFHDELGRLMGQALTTGASDLSRLPPRVRQTLDCLLEGDSEKQAATRLGLSRATVHQYVTDLYRRFGVASRAELLARFVR